MLRVIHFSDPHVSVSPRSLPLRSLRGKRLVGAINQMVGRGVKHRAAEMRLAALQEFQRTWQADALVCSGDWTVLGTAQELEHAAKVLQPLRASAPSFYSVYGNHDDYIVDPEESARVLARFDAWLPPAWSADHAWPRGCALGPDAYLVALNSVLPRHSPLDSSGYLDSEALGRFAERLAALAETYAWVLVMTHYAPLRSDGKPDSPRHGLHQGAALDEVLQTVPGAVVLHGHLHHRFAWLGSAQTVPHFCAGSLSHAGREGFWSYEIAPDRLRAQGMRWSGDKFVNDPQQSIELRR